MTDTNTPPQEVRTRASSSRGFINWMVNNRCSIAVTTYQTGQICCIGVAPDGSLSFREHGYARALGLYTNGQAMLLAAQSVLWRLENSLAPGEHAGIHDRLFQPRIAYMTGDIDIHELAIGRADRIVFVNTKYSCLATVSPTHSFKPLWTPPFISRLAPEDRCHLNGLGMVDGEARYVTAVGATDIVDGWRGDNMGGGVLMDVRDNRVIAGNLSVPHSPRWHQGRIWLGESGRGQIVAIDPDTGAKEDIVFCPGFLRGLAFHGGYALVTTSTPRDETFRGLALDEVLKAKRATPRCGIFIIDTRNGALVEWMMFEGQITELFDVAVLPGIVAPMAEGPATPHLGSRETIEPE